MRVEVHSKDYKKILTDLNKINKSKQLDISGYEGSEGSVIYVDGSSSKSELPSIDLSRSRWNNTYINLTSGKIIGASELKKFIQYLEEFQAIIDYLEKNKIITESTESAENTSTETSFREFIKK